jgi:hypothetical protein
MKLSQVLLFFGVPLLLFGVFFVARYAYGARVPVVFLIILSFIPLGFIAWIGIRNVVRLVRVSWGFTPYEDPLQVTYQESKGVLRYAIFLIGAVFVLAAAMYIIWIFF